MADISGLSFGMPVDVLIHSIRGADLENTQIANNIANANTPNFRRSDVSFKETLAESLGTPADPDVLPMKVDGARQFAIGDAMPPIPYVQPKAKVDETTQMRVDKSNVDIDQEMAKLSGNSGYSQTMSEMLGMQFTRFREAITEQAH